MASHITMLGHGNTHKPDGGKEEELPCQERIATDITQLIGWTPLLDITRIPLREGALARIVAKLECFQPFSSVKDRIALSMIEDAEKKGLISPGVSTLVEPTGGNTGISLAFVGINRGYKVAVVMPTYASLERRVILRALGADIYLSDPALGFSGLFAKCEQLVATLPNAHMLNQTTNLMNTEAHFQTTGPEIWKDTSGKVDILVAGSGTGGTFSGTGRYLKMKKPSVKVIVVEPSESPVISGSLSFLFGIGT